MIVVDLFCYRSDYKIDVNISSILDASNRFNVRMYKNDALPVKSIKQDFDPSGEQMHMMEIFPQMVIHSIKIGIANNYTLKRLSKLIQYNRKRKTNVAPE